MTVGLLPMPATSRTGVAYFDSLADAGRAVTAIIAGGTLPATLEFLDRTCIGAVEDFAQLGLDRERRRPAAVRRRRIEPRDVAESLERMAAACTANGARGVELAPDVAGSEHLLAARRCSLPALSRLAPVTMLEDVTVPRPQLAAHGRRRSRRSLVATTSCARPSATPATATCTPRSCSTPTTSTPGGAPRPRSTRSSPAPSTLGGTITGEHGVGAAKLRWLGQRLGADQLALLRRIKAAFDPAGILNPGKLGS